MDLVGIRLSSCSVLVKYFWRRKPVIVLQNLAFSFRYSEIVDLVKDGKVITTVMIELTSAGIQNLPILSLAQKCFEKLNSWVPLYFVLASGNRQDRIQLYVVPIIRTEEEEANLLKRSNSSSPARLERNRQRAAQYYLKKLSEISLSEIGGGMGTVPNSISDMKTNLETKNNEPAPTPPQTEVQMTKKVKSPKKQERDKLRAEHHRIKLAEIESPICQMWTVPIEAKSFICRSKSNSENSNEQS